MRYFKKFTDFCSGFACFTALLFLFREYMTFDVGDTEIKLVEKLKLFFSRQTELEHYLMLVLSLMLAVSVVAGIIFKSLPQLTVIFSLPPLVLSMDMVKSEYIEEYPMMYPLLSAIAVIGGIFECVRMDRTDGKRRSAWAGNIACAFSSVFCFFVYRRSQILSAIENVEASEMRHFDYEIYSMSENMNMKLFLTFAIVFLCLAVLGVILSDIYFIDAIVSLPLAVALIYLWGADRLTVHPEMLVTLGIAVFAMRIIPTVSCRARYT